MVWSLGPPVHDCPLNLNYLQPGTASDEAQLRTVSGPTQLGTMSKDTQLRNVPRLTKLPPVSVGIKQSSHQSTG